MTREQANRITWFGWALVLPLGYLGPVFRMWTGVRGSGKWPVFLGVVVMLVVLARVRRDERALSLAIHSNLSGLLIGAAGGFVTVALSTGRGLAALIALQMAFGAAFLTWLFRKTLHETNELTPAQQAEIDERFDLHVVAGRWLGVPAGEVEARLETLSDAEREELSKFMAERFEANMAEIRTSLTRSNRRITLLLATAGIIFVAGATLLILSRR